MDHHQQAKPDVGSSLPYDFHSLLNVWMVQQNTIVFFFFAGRHNQMLKYAVFRNTKQILQSFSATPLS